MPVISGHIMVAFTQFEYTSVLPVLPIEPRFEIGPQPVAFAHQVNEPAEFEAEPMVQLALLAVCAQPLQLAYDTPVGKVSTTYAPSTTRSS
jgi:hypothetical protein